MSYKDIHFEDALEAVLLTKDYCSIDKADYDIKTALFPKQVIRFIEATQPEEWKYLQALHKDNTAEVILADLVKVLDSEQTGCLAVLRHGFKCYGRTLRMAYFQPMSGLNPEAQKLYEANLLGITRQLQYSSDNSKSLDLVISLNGIPIITMELKTR